MLTLALLNWQGSQQKMQWQTYTHLSVCAYNEKLERAVSYKTGILQFIHYQDNTRSEYLTVTQI